MVSLATGQGRSTTSWVFLYDGESVTPVNPESGYGSVQFVDIDGDGRKELIDSWTDGDDNVIQTLYRLNGGMYSEAEPVFYLGDCVRGTGKPFAQTGRFSSSASSATLLVLNGVDGAPRSAAIEVELNGQKIVSPDQLNEKVGRRSIPVNLLTDDDLANEITCRHSENREEWSGSSSTSPHPRQE